MILKKIKQSKNIWDYLLILHLLYPISIIIIHFFFPDLYKNGDFLTFYYSVRRFYSDISQLYIITEFAPFRYLPISPIFYSYLLLFDQISGYIFTLILILITNYFLRRVVLNIAQENFNLPDDQLNRLKKMMFIIFILPFNFDIYYNGQMISLTLVFVLLSYYFFKKKENIVRNNIIGSLFISFSILLKPFFVIILPFLLKIRVKRYKVKVELLSLFRYFFVILLLGINGIIFLLNTQLLNDFVGINSIYLFFEASQSLTNILFLTSLNPQLVFFSLLLLFFSILFIFYLIKGFDIDLFYFYGISIIILMIILPQTWPFYNFLFFFALLLMSTKLRIDKEISANFKLFWIYILLNVLNYAAVSFLILIEIISGGIHLHIISTFSFLMCFVYYIMKLRDL